MTLTMSIKTRILSTLETESYQGTAQRYSLIDHSKRDTTSLKKFLRRPGDDRIFLEADSGEEIILLVIGILRYSETISLQNLRRRRSTSSRGRSPRIGPSAISEPPSSYITEGEWDKSKDGVPTFGTSIICQAVKCSTRSAHLDNFFLKDFIFCSRAGYERERYESYILSHSAWSLVLTKDLIVSHSVSSRGKAPSGEVSKTRSRLTLPPNLEKGL